ncbi:MAG: hypothetical protein MI924_17185 [Chloroflexales bacterium]|nr:hypothetical protein [Chloroflexales bacterium]
MAVFGGEWVFDLTAEGRVRRYHGPGVLGVGLELDGGNEGGLWPRCAGD